MSHCQSGRILTKDELHEVLKRGPIRLNAAVDVPCCRERAQNLALPSAARPASATPPPSSASRGAPLTLADAIAEELRAGAGGDAAANASRKYPHLVRAWLSGLQQCAGLEPAQ